MDEAAAGAEAEGASKKEQEVAKRRDERRRRRQERKEEKERKKEEERKKKAEAAEQHGGMITAFSRQFRIASITFTLFGRKLLDHGLPLTLVLAAVTIAPPVVTKNLFFGTAVAFGTLSLFSFLVAAARGGLAILTPLEPLSEAAIAALDEEAGPSYKLPDGLDHGSWALVTGAAGGVGWETAKILADRGWNIVAIARDAEKLDELAREIGGDVKRPRLGRLAAKLREKRGEGTPTIVRGSTSLTTEEGLGATYADGGQPPADGLADPSAGPPTPTEKRSDGADPGAGAVRSVLRFATADPGAGAPSAADRHVQFIPLACDLSRHGAGQAVASALQAAGVRVDVMMHCASCAVASKHLEGDAAKEEEMLSLHVGESVALTRNVLEQMVERRRGRVGLLSSVASAVPTPHAAVYGASRAFLASYAKALHFELAGSGVGVTTLQAGMLPSGLHRGGDAHDRQVAEAAVRATLAGELSSTTGWWNKLTMSVMSKVMPPHLQMFISEFSWRPLVSHGVTGALDETDPRGASALLFEEADPPAAEPAAPLLPAVPAVPAVPVPEGADEG